MTVTTFSNFLLIAYPNNIVSTVTFTNVTFTNVTFTNVTFTNVTFTNVTFTLAMRSYFLFKRSLD